MTQHMPAPRGHEKSPILYRLKAIRPLEVRALFVPDLLCLGG